MKKQESLLSPQGKDPETPSSALDDLTVNVDSQVWGGAWCLIGCVLLNKILNFDVIWVSGSIKWKGQIIH